MPGKWLVLFNCQAIGLANCLESLSPGLEVERFDALSAREQMGDIGTRLHEFERIVIAPRVKAIVGENVASRDQVLWMPHVWYQAYHPDLCYLGDSGPLTRGAAGPYHSMIAFVAYDLDMTVEQALALYRTDVYAAMGYLDSWNPARAGLLRDFDEHGFDLRPSLPGWARRGAFMHSVNHPKIEVLMDLARHLLRKAGRPVVESGIVPHDNLANGPVFAVYPEIGSRLGVAGAYAFKRGATYRVKPLDQFVHESFELYRSLGAIVPSNAAFVPAIERAREIIRKLHAS